MNKGSWNTAQDSLTIPFSLHFSIFYSCGILANWWCWCQEKTEKKGIFVVWKGKKNLSHYRPLTTKSLYQPKKLSNNFFATVLWQGSFLQILKKISCPIGSKAIEIGIIISIVDIEKVLMCFEKKSLIKQEIPTISSNSCQGLLNW